MLSKWYELKPKALLLRKKGYSIRDIETQLGIPRSTLSGWLQSISMSDMMKKALREKHEKSLISARLKAAEWHRQQKKLRDTKVKEEAIQLVESITDDMTHLEIALAFLYLGEGAKKAIGLSLGNSNPSIVKFFIKSVQKLYGIQRDEIRCDLHLRADQHSKTEIAYWMNELGLSASNFTKPVFDNRTKGKTTYAGYHGVCSVRCAHVAYQRKLMYIATEFCEKNLRD